MSLKELTYEELNQYFDLYKNELTKSKRFEMIKTQGYDTKFAYHIIRLIDEVEQILTHGDIDLQRANEMMKSVRRGEWPEQKIYDYFSEKEKSLERLYVESKLPHSPNENKIKTLLLECLEMHYGSLQDCIKLTNLNLNTILDEVEYRLELIRKSI